MPEIAPLGDYGEVKVPNLLDIQAKQAQTDKYNLDVAGAARDFYALKQYGEGAARGDPEATIQLNAKNPEAGNILANIGKTTIETKQAKETLVKGAAARVAQTASQFSDPAIQTQVFHNGIDLLLSQRAISQAEADNYKSMASADPQGMIRGIIHGNLGAAATPLVVGQAAQREAEGREPPESRLARQRGSYNQPHIYEREVPDPDNPGKTKIERGYVNPVQQPGAEPGSGGPAAPGGGGAPTIDQFGNPIRPGSGSSTGPGAVRTSGVVTAPSTYIPGSGSSTAPEIPAPPEQFKGMISAAATKHGVPEELLTRVLHGESGYNPNNVGPMTRHGTAKGIAQFIDSTAQSRGVKQFDPASSIDGAAAYLAELKQQRGSWYGAISGYLGAPPNPRNNRSYFDSGVVQTARSLDARGAAPPAPGSTAPPGTAPAPGSSLPIPGPASATPSPASVPPLVTPPGSSSATTPEIPPLSSTTARTAPRAAGAGFDLATGDSIAYGAARNAGVPAVKVATKALKGAADADAAGSRNSQEVLDYVTDHRERLAGKNIFHSTGLMNDGSAAESNLPLVEEQLRQMKEAGANNIVVAGVDTSKKYGHLNPKLQEMVDNLNTELGGGIKFGGPLPTNNVHPGPQGYKDYVANAAKLLEEKRSDAEPEALSGGSTGPVPTTASSAGEDTTSPASSYNTPATTPSSTTLSGTDRGASAPPGTWTPAPSQSALEAEKEKVTNPIKTQQHQDISDIDINKQDKINRMEYEKEESKGLLSIGDKEYADVSTQAKEALPSRIHLNQLRSILESGEVMGPTADKRKAIMAAVVEASDLLHIGNVPEWKQTVAMQKLFQSIGTQLGFDMAKSLGSREAMQVVAQVMQIKPNMLSTNEENRVIIASLDQAFRIMQEKQKFFEDYRTKHMDDVKKSGKYSTGFYGAQRAFDEPQSVHKLASEVVPYQPTTKDKMIDGVTYDLSKKGDDFKDVIGVWDSKEGDFDRIQKVRKY